MDQARVLEEPNEYDSHGIKDHTIEQESPESTSLQPLSAYHSEQLRGEVLVKADNEFDSEEVQKIHRQISIRIH